MGQQEKAGGQCRGGGRGERHQRHHVARLVADPTPLRRRDPGDGGCCGCETHRFDPARWRLWCGRVACAGVERDSPSQVPARSLETRTSWGGRGSTWGRSSGTGEGAPDDGSGRETSLGESLLCCVGERYLPQVAGRMSSLMSANVWLCSASQAAIRAGSQISTRLS